MARLLKIDLEGNIPVRIFTTLKKPTVTECYIHSTYFNLSKIRLGCNVTVVMVSLASSISQPLYFYTFKNSLPMNTSDLLKEIELLRQINAIQQQTIDSLTKSQQNILNNLLRKDNRVTSLPVKIILN